jgi:hypothetical protein
MQGLWPPLESVPAAQAMQVLAAEAPVAAECVPAAQAMQTMPPSASEYVPVVQGWHVGEPGVGL